MSELKIGKLDNDVLKKIVLDKIRLKRPEVRTRASVGEDCAVIDFGEYECVISTDPITADVKDIGRLAIHISCNDIASNGIEPLGITLACMLPPGVTEQDVARIMEQASEAAEEAGVEIIGGHTEVTPVVTQPVIVSTAFGRGLAGASQSAKRMRPGDLLLMTKTAGLEGTGIIAADKAEELADVLTEEELEHARGMLRKVSVVREGIAAGRIGTTGMHDVTEGGIYGAVWEMCRASGLGVRIDATSIPVDPVTVKICDHYGLDWHRLISSGCMLISALPSKAYDIVIACQRMDPPVEACVIGRVYESGAGVKILSGDGRETKIDPPGADELYKVINRG
jgi:hydrogenase expression/formation protein HypE